MLVWNVRESSSGKGRTFESSRARKQFACRERAGSAFIGLSPDSMSAFGQSLTTLRFSSRLFPIGRLSRYHRVGKYRARLSLTRSSSQPSPPTKNKIVSAKAAPRNIALTGFECRDIIEILGSIGDRPDNTLAMHWFPQRNNHSTVVVVIVTIELWIGLGRL